MKINICFSTDNNYIKPLYSSITSILKNADIDTDLNIFILENDLSDKNKNILLNLKTIKECEIKFIKIETTLISDLPDFKENLNYISKTSFFRFFVADLLKDIDKIIYLDCDIIVLSDLKSLFIQDIQNNYIAAVEDIGYYCNLSKHKYLKNFDFYINAGVLLINLQIWRQKKLSLTLSNIGKQKIKDFIFLDQDILNVVCKNKIKLLDFSYNVQTDCLKKGILSKHPKKKRIKEDIKKTKIIHYTSSKKPWNSFDYIPLRKYYLQYEKLTPFKTKYTLKTKIKFFVQDLYFNSIFLPVVKKIQHLLKRIFN